MVDPITLTLIAIGAIITATAGGVGAGCYMATSSLTCAEGSPHLQGCAANATSRVAASWKVIDTTNTEATISVTTGVDRTNEWAQDVEAITSSSWAAFTLDTIGGVEWLLGAPPSFDGPHPRSTTNRYATTYNVLKSERDSLQISCPPGAVWQWTLDVRSCAESEPTEVGTRHLRCSTNRAEPPCCIPGFDANPTNPTAGCLQLEGASMRLGGAYCTSFKDVDSKSTTLPPAVSSLVQETAADARHRVASAGGAPVLGGLLGLGVGMLAARVVVRPVGAAEADALSSRSVVLV